MASLLQEQLTRPLPHGSLLLDTMFMTLDRQGCDTRELTGRSLGKILLNPHSDIDLLKGIKDCGKKLSCALESEAERTLATTLYFAALASALVYHERKITESAYEKLNESFALLMQKKWMTQELIELFTRARHICAVRKGEE
jgi:hypothetical protein